MADKNYRNVEDKFGRKYILPTTVSLRKDEGIKQKVKNINPERFGFVLYPHIAPYERSTGGNHNLTHAVLVSDGHYILMEGIPDGYVPFGAAHTHKEADMRLYKRAKEMAKIYSREKNVKIKDCTGLAKKVMESKNGS